MFSVMYFRLHYVRTKLLQKLRFELRDFGCMPPELASPATSGRHLVNGNPLFMTSVSLRTKI